MTGKVQDEKKTDLCEDSHLPKSDCECLVCSPDFFDINQLLVECSTLDNVVRKLESALDFFHYLQRNGFGAGISTDNATIKLIPSIVEDYSWVRCEGCGYPALVPKGENQDILCEDCHTLISSRKEGVEPSYYDDLFDYIGQMFEKASDGEKPLTEAYGFTREFCEIYGFDFELIKARLQVTGGYDDAEVLMNSQFMIPRFDLLPLLEDSE